MRYAAILSILTLTSCGQFHSAKDPRTIRGINPIFQPYIEQYTTYKGSLLDYEIAIQFSDLPENQNGRCTKFPSGERQIEIDQEWWDNYSYDNTRFTVIAHELGHCDLNRRHVATLLPNGKPTSIMFPYNFSIFPEDMDYYIKELFNR